MTNKRLQMILMAALGTTMVLFILVYFVGMSILSGKSNNMVELKLQTKVLDEQLSNLLLAKNQVQTYGYIKNVAKEIIPSDKDQAQAVLEIYKLAKASGIAIQNITFPASTLSAAGANAAKASSSSLISQAKPVSGISGLYSVQLIITPGTGSQVTANQQVTYPKMLDFLDRIERNQRTAQITQVTIHQLGADSGPTGTISFSLTINIFIKP